MPRRPACPVNRRVFPWGTFLAAVFVLAGIARPSQAADLPASDSKNVEPPTLADDRSAAADGGAASGTPSAAATDTAAATTTTTTTTDGGAPTSDSTHWAPLAPAAAAAPGTPAPPAEAPKPKVIRFGWEFALSIGFPGGDAWQGTPLNTFVNELYEFRNEANLVLFERLVLGAHFTFGLAAAGDTISQACEADDTSCFGYEFDVGGEASFLILPPTSPLIPWIGAGVGYEYLSVGEDSGPSVSLHGSDIDIRGGVDLPNKKGNGGLGVFGGYRFGSYTTIDISDSSNNFTSNAITDQSGHGWVFLGARLRI